MYVLDYAHLSFIRSVPNIVRVIFYKENVSDVCVFLYGPSPRDAYEPIVWRPNGWHVGI